MAKIQSLGSGAKIKTNVNVASQQSGPSALSTLAKVGGQVANTMAQMQHKRNVAEDTNYSDMSKSKLDLETKRLRKNLEKEYAGNPSGFTEEFNSRFQDIRQGYLDDAPSEGAKRLFEGRSSLMGEGYALQASSYETKMKSVKYVSDRKKVIDVDAEAAYENPDPAASAALVRAYTKGNAAQVNLSLSQGQADGMSAAHVKSVRQNTMMGYIDNVIGQEVTRQPAAEGFGTATAAEAKSAFDAMLAGDENTKELFAGMKPSERNSYKRAAYAKIDAEFTKEKSHLKQRAGIYKDSVTNGTLNMNKAGDVAKLAEFENKIKASSSLDSFEKSGYLKDIYVAKVKQKVQSGMALLSPDAQEATLKEVATDAFETSQGLDSDQAMDMRGEMQEVLSTAIEDSNKAFNKDPVGFMAKASPDIALLEQAMMDGDPNAFQSLKEKADALYDVKGAKRGGRKYLSEATAKKWGQTFKDSMAEGDTATALGLYSDIENMTGGNSYGVMKELKLPDSMVAIGEADIAGRKRLLDIAKMEKDGSLKKAYGDLEDFKKDDKIKEELMDGDFYKALKSSNFESLTEASNTNALLNQAVKVYKAEMIQNQDTDSAEEAAWEIFSRNKTVLDGGDVKSNLILPKGVATDEDLEKVQTFISSTTGGSEEDVGKFLTDADLTNVAGDDEPGREMISENGYWSHNKADGRIYLRVRTPGTNTGAKGGSPTHAVKGKDGSPLSYTPAEMAKRVSKDMEVVQDRNKKKSEARKLLMSNMYNNMVSSFEAGKDSAKARADYVKENKSFSDVTKKDVGEYADIQEKEFKERKAQTKQNIKDRYRSK